MSVLFVVMLIMIVKNDHINSIFLDISYYLYFKHVFINIIIIITFYYYIQVYYYQYYYYYFYFYYHYY